MELGKLISNVENVDSESVSENHIDPPNLFTNKMTKRNNVRLGRLGLAIGGVSILFYGLVNCNQKSEPKTNSVSSQHENVNIQYETGIETPISHSQLPTREQYLATIPHERGVILKDTLYTLKVRDLAGMPGSKRHVDFSIPVYAAKIKTSEGKVIISNDYDLSDYSLPARMDFSLAPGDTVDFSYTRTGYFIIEPQSIFKKGPSGRAVNKSNGSVLPSLEDF